MALIKFRCLMKSSISPAGVNSCWRSILPAGRHRLLQEDDHAHLLLLVANFTSTCFMAYTCWQSTSTIWTSTPASYWYLLRRWLMKLLPASLSTIWLKQMSWRILHATTSLRMLLSLMAAMVPAIFHKTSRSWSMVLIFLSSCWLSECSSTWRLSKLMISSSLN